MERERAATWKRHTRMLPDEARVPAPYVDKDGRAGTALYDFCLPPEHAALSLLPEVREMALDLFAELGIPWHAGVGAGPGNHLLSSQVQCVNALGQMVTDPSRIVRAFGDVLGTVEVLPIEPGRFLTFEYIGPTDFFGEAPGGERTRGARCTSVDAAFVHRTREGLVELVLLEWKYTESYRPRQADPAKDRTRLRRYGQSLAAPQGPVRDDLLDFADLLDEPFYQLMRQQLLAHELEKARAHGADRVRVVHVLPKRNVAYQQSLRPAHRALGDTVSEVWQQLLRRPDRFVPLDSALFDDPKITSAEYASRYGNHPVASTAPGATRPPTTRRTVGGPRTMSYPCPYCPTVGTYRNNIARHLQGKGKRGHELNESEADAVIASTEAGTDVDIAPRAGGHPGARPHDHFADR